MFCISRVINNYYHWLLPYLAFQTITLRRAGKVHAVIFFRKECQMRFIEFSLSLNLIIILVNFIVVILVDQMKREQREGLAGKIAK